jgi:predicted lipid carrier protein YhbT
MQTSPYLLPQAVGQVLSRLPAYPGSLLFVSGLNLALAKKLQPDVTALLCGKKLRLRVADARWTFDFEWRDQRFSACQNPGAADLTIAASAYDFVLLARRQEDPDTLFFSRRLCMEGDTELGLLVKNTIDAIELPALLEQFKPAQVLATLKARLLPRQPLHH